MNDKPKGTTFPKQQLEIVKYEADIPYGTGGKTLDRMNAKNLSLQEGDPLVGRAIRFTIFNGELKTFLRGQGEGARFLCDVEERERPDSEYGPDRTIVQVYKDGNPISTKKGGGGYGKSPEIVRLEHELDLELEGVKRRSIEGQTAVAQVGLVLTSPTPIPGEDLGIDEDDWKRILGKYWQAVEKSLDNFLAPQPAKTAAAPLKPDQRPQDSKQAAEKPAAVAKDTPPVTDPIKHVGDLLTRAGKLAPPVTRADFVELLSINDPKEITDLEDAWKKAQELSVSRRTKSSEGKGEEPERLFE
ncbi:hypothetical protein ES703_25809 [subsurface metagenome]